MDHLAWLNAVPDVKRKSGDDRPRLSRREQYERTDLPFDEPPRPDAYVYLIEWWLQAGMVSQGGMGPVPLSRLELRQFDEDECLRMDGWERSQIIKMSRRYCWGQQHYKTPGIAPPYMSDETRAELDEYQESQRRLSSKLKDLGIKLTR